MAATTLLLINFMDNNSTLRVESNKSPRIFEPSNKALLNLLQTKSDIYQRFPAYILNLNLSGSLT